jgi:PadR family transcriptional regulator, regulatory protein PadR
MVELYCKSPALYIARSIAQSRWPTAVDGSVLLGVYLVQKGILSLGERSSNPDLLPGTLYMMILRTLNQGPLHGYAIARRIQDWSKGDLVIEDGSLYPALNRMLLKGWLKAEWGETQNNRKARFYRLTPEGKKRLEAESSAFNKMVRAIQLVMRTS